MKSKNSFFASQRVQSEGLWGDVVFLGWKWERGCDFGEGGQVLEEEKGGFGEV